MAYSLRPGSQRYIAQTKITDGKFILKIPANAPTGTFRLVYALPQDEYFFDVLYNAKEDIVLTFDAENGSSYKTSEENKVFYSYFYEIYDAKKQFIDYYKTGNKNEPAFKKLVNNLENVQTTFEEETKGMLAHDFIAANRPYIPKGYEDSNTYWKNKKKHYFDYLDINNKALQASGFLTDKLNGYVFTAISAEKKTKTETENFLKKNIETVSEHLEDTSPTYKLFIYKNIWTKAASHQLNDTSDFIYNTYIEPLKEGADYKKIVREIQAHNRLRFGAEAPEITWQEGNATKRLSELEDADCYVIIFWSSTCSHCLHELPALHKKLKEYHNIKVIAVGLEDDETNWKTESAKLNGFSHAIALGKWNSQYAKLYDIHRTPTYFVLDKDKRFFANPKDGKEVLEYATEIN